jgi:heterodisulfide reductase subunit A-like polyferredoxin
LKPEYGCGRYPNVITSLEFERLLSATGPCAGHVRRPSDQGEPKRIAWIQCVGSRDASIGREYCSYVCCMYAAKQFIIAKEHDHGVTPTIFSIDFRAQGKGFDRYYERARDEHGVRLIRDMISRVTEDPRTHNLELTYVDEDGRLRLEEFDMVVLSVGLTPHPAATMLAAVCGIDTDQWGFVKNPPFKMVETSREGIYICGVFQSPKDIPETVGQAGVLEPLHEFPFPVARRALVLGGGLAGLVAALTIANAGYRVYLPDIQERFGGSLAHKKHFTLEGHAIQPYMQQLIRQVEDHPNIRWWPKARMTSFSGHVGSFSSRLSFPDNKWEIHYGAAVIATGAVEYQPTEYLYGEHPRVMTQVGMENLLVDNPDQLGDAPTCVMIQCVGSRSSEHPYCSRVCCGAAVKNSLRLKEIRPQAKIFILYRDIHTYGLKEIYYKKARDLGVQFIRFEPDGLLHRGLPGLLNGPCGGTVNGHCEVDPEKECAWCRIYHRLELEGRLDNLKEILPLHPHDRTTTPGTVIHPAYKRRYGPNE